MVTSGVTLARQVPVIEKHLEHLASDLEMESFGQKNDRGFFRVTLSKDWVLELQELDPGFLIHSCICPCPLVHRESLFIYLMKANFLGLGTGGAAIGLDKAEKHLTLSRIIPYDVNYKSFKEIIEDFTNYLDLWQQEVQRHQKAEEERTL